MTERQAIIAVKCDILASTVC